MSESVLDRVGGWTFDQLADLPADGRRYEVVDGHLVVTPPPSHEHQTVSNRLARQLAAAAPREWEAFVEFALPLGSDGRVPDISVVRSRPLARGRSPYPRGPDDFGLVVEVTSPSTRKTDLFAKPGEYAEAGIPLFWRVDVEPELRVTAYRLDAGAYAQETVVRDAGGVCAVPWGEITLDLARIATG